MPRWAKVLLVVLALLVAGVAIAVAVVWAKLPQIAATLGTKAAGRTVKVGGLSVSPGRWVTVDLRDASLANLEGGTRPEMATVGRVTGEVALWPLLHGTVVARSVRIEKADVLLEKVGQQPNWRNGPKQPEKPDHGRSSFPTLLGVELQGVVTFRTSSGSPLVTKLDGVKLEADAADQPARLVGPGSYQGAPVVLDVGLGSFDQLHDAATPFPTDVKLTSGDTVLHFVGTMTDPLNVDGAEGQLSITAPTPGALEKIAGVDPSPAPPAKLAGAFQHDKNLWKLEQAKGAIGAAVLEDGTLQLKEGDTEKKEPDRIAVQLRFDQVEADRLMAQFKSKDEGKGGSSGPSSFVPQAAPNPEVEAKLEAAGLTFEKIHFSKPKLAVSLEPRLLKLDGASFGALGGQVSLEGQVKAEADGKTGALLTTATATGLEVSDLRQTLGMGHLPLAGRIDLHAVAEGAGTTAEAAMTAGRASVVATMQGGSVSEQVIELASTDVAGLVRSSRTMVPLNCLLAAMEVRGGVATVGPVRLRSSQGTIVARGQVDLLRQTLDMVVASEAKTTGALALDVPVRVHGSFDDPSIAPAGAEAGRAALAGRGLGALAGSVRGYAARSSCAK